MIYPWQDTIWQRLNSAFYEQKLPHALLVTGIAGIGKRTFVLELVKLICCENREPRPCEAKKPCRACHLLTVGVHPNLYQLTPEKPGAAIKIDQVRDMIEFTQQSAYMGQYQCVIIDPVHFLNAFAANALLKTLEEPATDIFFFLVTEEYARLPATILSRTMKVNMPVPPLQEAIAWLQNQVVTTHDIDIEVALKSAMGAPLKALSFLNGDKWVIRRKLYQALHSMRSNPREFMALVNDFKEVDVVILCDLMLSCLLDLGKMKCGVNADKIDNTDYVSTLNAQMSSLTLDRINEYIGHLRTIRHQWLAGMNLNKTLSIENILMQWIT